MHCFWYVFFFFLAILHRNLFIGAAFIYNNYIGTVRVSFEQTVYEIVEDERTLRVCVSMETMEAFSSNFAVQITSTDKSAQGVYLFYSFLVKCFTPY